MAVFATFGANTLTVFGDNNQNPLELGRDAAGQIFVNNGAVNIIGGTPTVANTNTIVVFGLGGSDHLTVNEANGAMPRVNLFGGSGDDLLAGGSAGDFLFGQADNDILDGKGGNDFLFGGSGNDVLTGGDGNDQMFGEAGNDRMIRNPGDDNDLMEGGSGIDTAVVNGGNGGEVFTATANGARVRLDGVDAAPFALDIGTTENLVLNMNGGDDSFSATGNLAALISVTVDGGAGNDRILGGNGVDVLLGGDGNDFIDGNQGNDVAFLGSGNDVFQWDPGDGSDVVEGQAGFDTELFNGSAASEIMALRANGGRATLTRDVGNIDMDNNDIERFDINALGGQDNIAVRDLSGTDVQEVRISLAGTIGGTAGDAQADTVQFDGTGAADVVEVLGDGAGTLSVLGLPAFVQVSQSEAGDSLVIAGGGGDDQISASGVAAGQTRLTLDGGAGDDLLRGSRGADLMLGGDGDDFFDGRQGDDVALMGAGNDNFLWAPGDGNDTLEGQDGNDSMTFLGSNAAENIDISANGGRVRFFRDVANVVMDLNDVEATTFNAFGGADNIVIGDLSGTDLSRLEISLIGGSGQANDGVADSVTQNGTQGADVIVVSNANKQVFVDGLQVATRITGADAALDRLTINGQAGDDVIDATSLAAGVMPLTMNGGLGNDLFLGSAGDDLINGGDGDDVALMGAGDDTFVWNPGDDDDTLEGQAGTDTMLFNGANGGENIDISANGGRVRFFRDVANVTMDLNDTEVIDFNALGGADNIVVGDLSGTDVQQVRIDLAAAGGAGDGQADTVSINGSNGDDVAVLLLREGDLVVTGLAAEIVIENFDAATDRLVFNGLGGDDVVDATSLPADVMQLLIDGGAGNDVLLGSAGDDVLLGGDGDDVLLGGPGLDVIDGGAGDNVVIQ